MAGSGAAIGGTLGAVAGSIIPGVGTAIGGAVGSGIGSFVDSRIAKNKAESSEPPMTDPNQTLLLDEIARRRKAIEQGTDVMTQSGLSEIEETGAATRDALSRATGGNAGATVDALLKSQRMEDRNKGAILGQAQQRTPFLQNLEEQMTDKIAQRTLDLTQFNKMQANAEQAQFGKEALMNLQTGTATGAYDELFQGAGDAIQGGANKMMDAFTTMFIEPKLNKKSTQVQLDAMKQINANNGLQNIDYGGVIPQPPARKKPWEGLTTPLEMPENRPWNKLTQPLELRNTQQFENWTN